MTSLDWQIDKGRSNGSIVWLTSKAAGVSACISRTGRTLVFETRGLRQVTSAGKVVYPQRVNDLAAEWFGPRWKRGQ
jgi:hypothetical protein